MSEESSYRLPAHRGPRATDVADLLAESDLEPRKKGKNKGDGKKVWTFDFDETITRAPKRMAYLANALKAAGAEIWIITGNKAPRPDLEKRLADYGVEYDGLIQYDDEGSHGEQRMKVLKELNAWCAIDDRMGRAPTLTKACPHLFLAVKGDKEDKEQGDMPDPKDVVENAEEEMEDE